MMDSELTSKQEDFMLESYRTEKEDEEDAIDP